MKTIKDTQEKKKKKKENERPRGFQVNEKYCKLVQFVSIFLHLNL